MHPSLVQRDPFEIIADIISEIKSQAKEDWYIEHSRIIEILGIKKEDYYRIFYSLKDAGFNLTAMKGFSNEEVIHLMHLIDKVLDIGFTDKEFERRGICFSDEFEEELLTYFIDSIEKIFQLHKLDKELLMLLASSTREFNDAFDSYFEDKFAMEFIISRTVDSFLEKKEIEADIYAENILKNFLNAKSKIRNDRLRSIKTEYRDRFYFELYGRERKARRAVAVLTPEQRVLYNYFGLQPDHGKKELKKRYKELLKQYHPDINKSGLAKTKEIIENYNKLNAMMG